MEENKDSDNLVAKKQTDLTKLTVPQLKSLCKDKKLTGYSKLGKPALVQLLTVSGAAPNTSSVPGTQATSTLKNATKSAKKIISNKGSGQTAATPAAASSVVSSLPVPRSPATVSEQASCFHAPAPSSSSPHDARIGLPGDKQSNPSHLPNDRASANNTPPAPCVPLDTPQLPYACNAALVPSSSNSAVSLKRLTPPTSFDNTSSKKQKAAHIADQLPSTSGHFSSLAHASSFVPSSALDTASASPSVSSNIHPRRLNIDEIPNVIDPNTKSQHAPTGKRFRPLAINKAPAVSGLSPSGYSSAPPTQVPTKSTKPSLRYLESAITIPPVPLLKSITLPPSLSQRGRVKRWAVILSGLSDQERRQCILVSRMFRYAVYLSASEILRQHYDGKRLEAFLQKVNTSMTNLWPYLRQRQKEAQDRRKVYETSFLGWVLSGTHPIHARLWGSPDTERQVTIALRFILSRFWFSMSTSSKEYTWRWLDGTVTDAQEIIPGEIWRIDILDETRSRSTAFHVLEPTCEVVGHAQTALDSGSLLRADWSAYIQSRIRLEQPVSGELQTPTILDRLKWSNYEEYNRGISKLWLKRVESEGEEGVVKKQIAERYVLACVVGSSISGSWMTTTEMAQDFAGMRPVIGNSSTKCREPVVGLYLPAHHHVESVHLTSSKKEPLHLALAAVQTLHREYIILKDNGMVVGCEEDGVGDVWMKMLSCNSKGVAL